MGVEDGEIGCEGVGKVVVLGLEVGECGYDIEYVVRRRVIV